MSETCQDTADLPNSDTPFNLTKVTIEGSTQSGRSGTGMLDSKPSVIRVTDYPFPTISWKESVDSFYSRMVAGTAPNKPLWSAPTFLAELKDFGTIVKDIRYGFALVTAFRNRNGRERASKGWHDDRGTPEQVISWVKDQSLGAGISYGRKVANAKIAIDFGYSPYVSDVLTLLGCFAAVEARRKQLASLKERGVVTRMWKGQPFVEQSSRFQRNLTTEGNVWCTQTTVGEMWGQIKWFTGHNTSLPSTYRDLLSDMLGLHPRNLIPTLWEIMPWSWMIDYFSNVGDIVNSIANGSLQYTVRGNIMRRTILTVVHPTDSRKDLPLYDWQLKAGVFTRVNKVRHIRTGTPGLTVFDSILGPNQLSILGSLGVVKALPKYTL
jgi:hypothetical protein